VRGVLLVVVVSILDAGKLHHEAVGEALVILSLVVSLGWEGIGRQRGRGDGTGNLTGLTSRPPLTSSRYALPSGLRQTSLDEWKFAISCHGVSVRRNDGEGGRGRAGRGRRARTVASSSAEKRSGSLKMTMWVMDVTGRSTGTSTGAILCYWCRGRRSWIGVRWKRIRIHEVWGQGRLIWRSLVYGLNKN